MVDRKIDVVVKIKREERKKDEPPKLHTDLPASMTFQQLLEQIVPDVSHITAKCRVGFKKRGEQIPTDFVEVELNDSIGKLNVTGSNFIDFSLLKRGEKLWRTATSKKKRVRCDDGGLSHHELSGVFVVRQDVSCADPVDKLYYSCRKFEEICCWCGALEPEARINDQTRAIYKVVNPVCQVCAAAGKRPVASCKKSRMAGGRNE